MDRLMTEFSTMNKPSIHCAYFPQCSGCSFQENVTHPPIWEDVQSFFNKQAILITGSTIHWRTRSKLAVRGSIENPQIGLFRQNTHDVVSIPHCPLHHPYINRAYQTVQEAMIRSKIPPYNEQTITGAIRYLQFAVERRNRKIQLAVVINRKGRDPQIDKFVKQLYTSGQFQGIWINIQPGSTNRILGDTWYLAEGEPYLTDTVGGVELFLHPACFAQAHLELFEKILSSIKESLLPEEKVVEYYAGVGVIGLACVSKSEQVLCTEINPFASECFSLSRLKLPMPLQKKIHYLTGDAGALAHLVDESTVVIVDPPRKGLDPALLLKLCQAPHLKQIIYLSCGFYSFQKECEQLLEQGWQIEKAEGYLLFPGSNHVEVLCVLRKST